MLKITPDSHVGTPISVDQHPEGYRSVELEFDVERLEVVGYHRPDTLATSLVDDLLGESPNRPTIADGIALARELVTYRELVVHERETLETVTRSLSPSEARELAAMLVHYAGEIEAGR